jgi:glc operon protein GlcG
LFVFFRLFPFRAQQLMLRPDCTMVGGPMTKLETLAGAVALALLAAAPAAAQTTPPPYGPPIGIEDARKVMNAAEGEASKNNWAVVISIIDSGGNIVMLHRRDDVQLSSIEIAQGKAKTALMFKRPSKVLDDAISSGGGGLRFLALKDIVPLEGGVPIVADGKIIGAIGVSGVLSAQDAQIARAGVDGLK